MNNVNSQSADQIFNAGIINQNSSSANINSQTNNAQTINQNFNVPLTINDILARSENEVLSFIEEFNEDLRDMLLAAKKSVFAYLVQLEEVNFEMFLMRYRSPLQKVTASDINGVSDLWKLLILCQVSFQSWDLDNSFITHNLFIGNDSWRRIVHSCWNNQCMPTIIIRLALEQKKHLGRDKIFPHRLIITNSNPRKDNLCVHCGKPIFPFEKILKDYGKANDVSIFSGIGYENSFKELDTVEVLDGYCMFNEVTTSTNQSDIITKVRSIL